MKRIVFELLVVLALAIALAWYFARPPVAPPAVAPKAAPRSARKHSLPPAKKLQDDPWSHRLESQARRSVQAWSRCFLEAAVVPPRAKLTMRWDGSSHLQALRVQPPMTDAVVECLSAEVRQWNLPAPPGLRPFQFEQEVWIGGR